MIGEEVSLEIAYLEKTDIGTMLMELHEEGELLKWCYTDKYGVVGKLQEKELQEVLQIISDDSELGEIYDFILNVLVEKLPYEVYMLF